MGAVLALGAIMNRGFAAQAREIGPERIGAEEFRLGDIELVERNGIHIHLRRLVIADGRFTHSHILPIATSLLVSMLVTNDQLCHFAWQGMAVLKMNKGCCLESGVPSKSKK